MVSNRSVPARTVLPRLTYRDLDGHHWLFSAHARDVSPDEWGATITTRPDDET